MAAADSARCQAKREGDGDGVIAGVAVHGGTGAEGEDQLSVVMKFGGSSVSSAARMKEVAGLIQAFPEERPVVVLSAMGKTTNLLLLVRLLSVSGHSLDLQPKKVVRLTVSVHQRIFSHGSVS